MKRFHFFHLCGAGLLLFLLSFSQAFADSATERIRERLPAIDALKESGLVGEDSLGYLAKRGGLSAEQNSLLEAENADRKALYALIAEKTRTSAVDVGKQRAVRIAQQAKRGLWIQTPSGEWVRKE